MGLASMIDAFGKDWFEIKEGEAAILSPMVPINLR
jgi:hypothetical protein